MRYKLARSLEILDLIVIFCFVGGFFIPYKFTELKLAHITLTWIILIAQLSYNFTCPLLVWANILRKSTGHKQTVGRFQPTFMNVLSKFISLKVANSIMIAAIIIGPFLATILYSIY